MSEIRIRREDGVVHEIMGREEYIKKYTNSHKKYHSIDKLQKSAGENWDLWVACLKRDGRIVSE